MTTPRHIVIVGGGFSGTVLAANLLRKAAQPLSVTIVDDGAPGQGLAYADRGHRFLLNVPAGRMSATSGQPMEFRDFARRSLPDTTAEDFLPRALYGQYQGRDLSWYRAVPAFTPSWRRDAGPAAALSGAVASRRRMPPRTPRACAR